MTIISSGIACRETRDQTPHTHACTHTQGARAVVRERERERKSKSKSESEPYLTHTKRIRTAGRSVGRSFVPIDRSLIARSTRSIPLVASVMVVVAVVVAGLVAY